MFGIVSDLHFHNWTRFASINDDGVNSRLQETCDAMEQAVWEMRDAGVRRVYIAGDIFHVRGEIKPSVLNPVLDMFERLTNPKRGAMTIRAIPGNHDLENKESDGLGNAISALTGVDVDVCDEDCGYDDDKVLMVPWMSSTERLYEFLERFKDGESNGLVWKKKDYSVICHAPLNNVIKGIPDHGLNPEDLAKLGFKNVFCGHYHDHKDMGGGVYSIGALTHQTFGDIGSKAGYMIVDGDDIKHRVTKAPKFVEINDPSDGDQMLDADGNYVRVRGLELNEEEIVDLRKVLVDEGARGVVIEAVKKAVTMRGTTLNAGASLENSLKAYADQKSLSPEVIDGAMKLLEAVKHQAVE